MHIKTILKDWIQELNTYITQAISHSTKKESKSANARESEAIPKDNYHS